MFDHFIDIRKFYGCVEEVCLAISTKDCCESITPATWFSIVSPCFQALLGDVCSSSGEVLRKKIASGACVALSSRELQSLRASSTAVGMEVALNSSRDMAIFGAYEALSTAMEGLCGHNANQPRDACGFDDSILFGFLTDGWKLATFHRRRIFACSENFDFRSEMREVLHSITSLQAHCAAISQHGTNTGKKIGYCTYSSIEGLRWTLLFHVHTVALLLLDVYTKFYNLFPWSRATIEDCVDALADQRANIGAEIVKLTETADAKSELSGAAQSTEIPLAVGPVSDLLLIVAGEQFECLFNNCYHHRISPVVCVDSMDLLVNTVSIAKRRHAAGSYVNSNSSAGSAGVSQLSSNKIRSVNSTAHPMRSRNSDVIH